MNKKPNKQKGLILLIIGIVLTLILPVLLTQCSSFDWADLTSSDAANIGSTIGGVTAPVVGLASIFFLYLALSEQKQANNLNYINSKLNWIRDLSLKMLSKYRTDTNPIADNYFDEVFMITTELRNIVSEINKNKYTFLQKEVYHLVNLIDSSGSYKLVINDESFIQANDGKWLVPEQYMTEIEDKIKHWKIE